jgi:hypothetical protein
MTDILAELRYAAARKWIGDQSAQRAGLFARAADEIEYLRANLELQQRSYEREIVLEVEAERERLLTAIKTQT